MAAGSLCHRLLPEPACPWAPANRQLQTAALGCPLSLPLLPPLSKPSRDERIPGVGEGRETKEGTSSKQPKEKGLYLTHVGKYCSNLLLSSGAGDSTLLPRDPVQGILLPWFIRPYLLSFLEATPNFQCCCLSQLMTSLMYSRREEQPFYISLPFVVTFHMFKACSSNPHPSLLLSLD